MTALPRDVLLRATRLTRSGDLNQALAVLQAQLGIALAPATREAAATPTVRPECRPLAMLANDAKVEPGTPAETYDSSPGRGPPARKPPSAPASSPSTWRQRMAAAMPAFAEAAGRSGRSPHEPALPPGARFESHRYQGPDGSRDYRLFVPGGHDGRPLPLLVMLHGCTQTPEDFAIGTGMNALAQAHGLLVAWPEQPTSANASRCWNWFNGGDQARGSGEPALLAGLTRAILAEGRTDPARVYVAGLSAGGAAAAILGAAYPDLYAAVAVHSGLACGSARDLPSALTAMRQGGAGHRGQAPVPTIVLHGDGDRTVHPANAGHVLSQAGAGSELTARTERGSSDGGVAWTRTVHTDVAGRELLEDWRLHGIGHAWSGGSADGSHTAPTGPDASAVIVRFLLQHAIR
jgi:poly(hydroxyalkanoate) depolymerase family esterase